MVGILMPCYPEMNAKIVKLLRMKDDPMCLYAADRIEELEAENARLRQAGKLALEFMKMIRESDGISLSEGREEYLLRKVLERDGVVEKYLQVLESGKSG